MSTLSRRQFAKSAAVAGLALLAGCGQLPWQAAVPPLRRIGFLGLSPQPYYEAFREGLRELGYVEGTNIAIEWRYTDGDDTRLSALAAELIGLPVEILVTAGQAAAVAAKSLTSTIPIVLGSATDPVGAGLVASLVRPGGNVTGVTNISSQLSAKQLELLKDTLAGLASVAVLWNMTNSGAMQAFQEVQGAAQLLGLALQPLGVQAARDLESAFAMATRERPDALLILRDSLTNTYRTPILDFAREHRLPTIAGLREYATEGGLLVYGPNINASYHHAAYYVDKILKGAKPADLPVEQPTIFEFVINLKTAQALGLTIPQSVLLQATEVIQ